ncbi:T9SS type A sorting domain-containing protein [Ichthyenterobacterium sp. W332]|uniref:T9SS type A sorting domain-containing protein n=1 Tax=Microcosmobacter mediterraneus TaxID=3075607 RepID=A0ABU2YHB1_9FLAO|nr:T9SS type A sorting domain-containing protein [Ichthyenterobacterium sp. W332]MDT0557084.1 T9SS type A sorting domain-containing protein [Ichthyenterobacterium sp. W332]
MKKNYTLLVFMLISSLGFSQGYEFALQHNGGYTFSVIATPDFDATDTDISDIGFALMLPAGNADVTNVSDFNARVWGTTEFTAAQLTGLGLGDGTRDGFLMNLPPGQTILSHSNGVPFTLVSFEVSNMPTAGVLEILLNTDPIAQGLGGAVDSFYNANIDMTTTQNYFAGITSGMESFMFSLLNVEEVTNNLELSVYPNPTKDRVTIQTEMLLDHVELYDITGKRIAIFYTKDINVSNLNSGVYLMKIRLENATVVKRVVKE